MRFCFSARAYSLINQMLQAIERDVIAEVPCNLTLCGSDLTRDVSTERSLLCTNMLDAVAAGGAGAC